jgi:cytochrome c oxidase assembly protein subunit 15
MSEITRQHESRWPHRWAVLLVCATFPLIWVGGLVTTYKAGMAVPDWPTTYGDNMFAYSWANWLAAAFNGGWDLFIEHGHRLLGSLVGFIAIGFVISTCLSEKRNWVRLGAILALILVVAQGAIGGARVLLDRQTIALIHACAGPLFFAYAIGMAVVTSKFWKDSGDSDQLGDDGRLKRIATATFGLSCVQLVLGGNLRHLHVNTSSSTFMLALAFHILVALVLTGHVAMVCWTIFRRHRSNRKLLVPGVGLAILITLQLLLGGSSWIVKYGWPNFAIDWQIASGYTVVANSLQQGLTVTAHVAVGSLILGTATLIMMRSSRLSGAVESKPCSPTMMTGLVV